MSRNRTRPTSQHLCVPAVVNLYSGKIMLAVGYRHTFEIIMAVDKITYKECRTALFHHIGEKLQRHINIGSPGFQV